MCKDMVFSTKTDWFSKGHSTDHDMLDQTKSSFEENDLTCKKRFYFVDHNS